jgi:hypothetical protein
MYDLQLVRPPVATPPSRPVARAGVPGQMGGGMQPMPQPGFGPNSGMMPMGPQMGSGMVPVNPGLQQSSGMMGVGRGPQGQGPGGLGGSPKVWPDLHGGKPAWGCVVLQPAPACSAAALHITSAKDAELLPLLLPALQGAEAWSRSAPRSWCQ